MALDLFLRLMPPGESFAALSCRATRGLRAMIAAAEAAGAHVREGLPC